MNTNIKIKDWNIEEQTGYSPLTTSYTDLSVAEIFGKDSIKDTYKTLREEFDGDYKLLTELTMALNWKSWEHANNKELCELYCNLFYEMDEWCCNNLKGEELSYYYRTTD